MLVDSVRAVVAAGDRAVVVLPGDGPLRPLLERAGAEIRTYDVPVLRKQYLRPARALGLAARMARAIVELRRLIRQVEPAVVYVNTLTIPAWLAAARLTRRTCLVHVHEAEQTGRLVGLALTAPLRLARIVVVNSSAASAALVASMPGLAARIELVYNGVAAPARTEPMRTRPGAPARLVLVGRLSPRKGSDVAVKAVQRLRADGRDVRLDLVGSTFDGYEWFEKELRILADEPPLSGRVNFHGFQADAESFFRTADLVLVPSRVEPFGNVAVEALLAGRPVIASATQGLVEIIDDGRTGLLVAPDDPEALAAAIARLLDDWPLATRLAAAGQAEAAERFGIEQYQTRIAAVVDGLAATR
ncbi:glycosyl transferase family 1 [Pseudofrankia sp. EUN1h]|nr:glycosyl transferase family 1 [Pseudofrankia sp. EUN1h]